MACLTQTRWFSVDELADNDDADGVTGEVDRIVHERGECGSPEHQLRVRWLNWKGDPTWEEATTIIHDVPRVYARWLNERAGFGWPDADVKEVERRVSHSARAACIERLKALTATKAARKRADRYVCVELVTATGFSPPPSLEPS